MRQRHCALPECADGCVRTISECSSSDPASETVTAMSPSNESEIIEIMKAALQSIANNTCCEGCQEAKMCARRAMAGLHSVSVSEGKAGSLHDAVVDYLNFLRRSVNVGPLTTNPTKEAALLRRLMDLTAVSSQAPERGQEGQ